MFRRYLLARNLLVGIIFIFLIVINHKSTIKVDASNLKNDASSFFKCNGAPFIIPTEGDLRYIWKDPTAYTSGELHTGLDIFGKPNGVTPIRAVYDGWLSRVGLSNVRIEHQLSNEWSGIVPELHVYTYYTHMASGSGDQSYIAIPIQVGDPPEWVQQGQIIGYQGNYNTPYAHLHISVNNGSNETILTNTYDPSKYFGSDLNFSEGARAPDGQMNCKNGPPVCEPTISTKTKSWSTNSMVESHKTRECKRTGGVFRWQHDSQYDATRW